MPHEPTSRRRFLAITAATGTGPFNYQWRRNGINLPGKTNLALVIPVVRASDAGSYDVVASNLGGSVTSAPPIMPEIGAVTSV